MAYSSWRECDGPGSWCQCHENRAQDGMALRRARSSCLIQPWNELSRSPGLESPGHDHDRSRLPGAIRVRTANRGRRSRQARTPCPFRAAPYGQALRRTRGVRGSHLSTRTRRSRERFPATRGAAMASPGSSSARCRRGEALWWKMLDLRTGRLINFRAGDCGGLVGLRDQFLERGDVDIVELLEV